MLSIRSIPTMKPLCVRRIHTTSPKEDKELKELLRSNNIVQISYLTSLLKSEGIVVHLLDTNMSVIEGSGMAIPRRLMVNDADFITAKNLLEELGE